MKKKIFIILSMLFFLIKANAQSYDTTVFYGKMNYIFDHVDKSQVSTGILRDYGIEFLNLDNYNGTSLHDSNFVSMDEWRLLYAGLYSSQINSNASLLYLDTVNNLVNKYDSTSQPITFIGFDFNYNKLKSNTISSNLMSITGIQLYDVGGRPQSPYESGELFAMAPIRQAAFEGSNEFMFRPELFLSNTGKTISNIAYDPAGGSSYTVVAFNTPFYISYDTTGFFDLSMKITYTDSSARYGHTKIVVYHNSDGSSRFGEGIPPVEEPVTAVTAYGGVYGEGKITIEYAVSNTSGHIKKPLIVVKGFDPTNANDYNDYAKHEINFDTNFSDWYNHPLVLNDGLDDINEYDLIYVDYTNGTDYIQRNAYVLEKAIEMVNADKTLWNGVRQQNVVFGLSMGGLVARYALRDMELNSVDHETRLLLTHDTPHWGANIPVGIQAAVQHLAPWKIINTGGTFPWIAWKDMFPQIADALDMYNTPAAEQMLIQRYTLSGETLTADNSVHESFMSELNGMGWPVNCRNVTLSNGACNGTKTFDDNSTIFTIDGGRDMKYLGSLWRSLLLTIAAPFDALGVLNGWGNPQFNGWALLWQFPLSLVSNINTIGLDFKIRAVPSSSTQEIYRGDVFSKRRILDLFNVTNYFIKCHVNSDTGMLPLDNAPGGVYDVALFGINAAQITDQLPNFFSGYVTATVLQNRFCFIPTVSSLAITDPVTYLTSDICDNIQCLNPPAVSDFFAPAENQIHVSYNEDNTDWILMEQDATYTCVNACTSNPVISGNSSFCTTSDSYSITNLKPGETVAWSVSPTGIVTINSPAATTTTLTETSSGKFTLTAVISNVCAGDITISKTNIAVGPPASVVLSSYSNLGICGDDDNYFQVESSGGSNHSGTLTAADPDGLATSFTWALAPLSSGANWAWSYTGSTVSVASTHTNVNITLRCTASNSCGSVHKDYFFTTGSCPLMRIAPPVQVPLAGVAKYSITPNPTSGTITIKLPTDDPALTIQEVVITNSLGTEVQRIRFSGGKMQTIDMQKYPADVYVVRVFNGKEWLTSKIIKQ